MSSICYLRRRRRKRREFRAVSRSIGMFWCMCASTLTAIRPSNGGGGVVPHCVSGALHAFQSVSRRRAAVNGRRLFSATTEEEENMSGYARPVVQWYPGHIAKAERMLQETCKAVDVLVEIRDARIPKATSHPMTASWAAGKPRIVVLTHSDVIPSAAVAAWKQAFRKFGTESDLVMDKQIQNQAAQAQAQRIKYTVNNNSPIAKQKQKQPRSNTPVSEVHDVLYCNGKLGAGIPALTRSILQAGRHVQERRASRGLLARPLRVGVLGYPNVGKSTIINQLLGGRKRAKTANLPGVTRSLQWIRVSSKQRQKSLENSFELLDSPGIIPAVLSDQSDAMLLAACNCIGNAAYDNQAVAAYLCEWLLAVHRLDLHEMLAPDWRACCQDRYKFDPLPDVQVDVEDDGITPIYTHRTGEDMLFTVADNTCRGNPEDAARKILQDFRTGRLGLVCLQVAPTGDGHEHVNVVAAQKTAANNDSFLTDQEQKDRAAQALAEAKERGLELPPNIVKEEAQESSAVGKGLFDGW